MSLSSWLRLLATDGLGPARTAALLEAFGSAEAVLEAAPSRLVAAGIPSKVVDALLSERSAEAAAQTESACKRLDIAVVVRDDPRYPAPLLRAPAAPPVLFLRGDAAALSRPQVAIVGTRKAGRYGRTLAAEFAAGLARAGLAITSGLALGIDGAAHEGALSAAGVTVAVCGTGLDTVYPPEHVDLAGRIIATGGALVSELPPGSPPRRRNFPYRNRIIAGLALATVVVEAPRGSGALITAHHAVDAGREVLVLPGRVDNPNFSGSHALLREGARPVTSVADVLSELPAGVARPPASVDERAAPRRAPPDLPAEERKLWDALEDGPMDAAGLADLCGIALPRVLATLVRLQMRGLVARLPGGRFERL